MPLPLRDPDAFQVLAREEQYLRKSLQAAIDAQSEGLVAGFAVAADDPAGAASPTSSKVDATSPTGRHIRRRSEHAPRRNGGGVVIPVRQPAPQKLGLQGARREISRAMAQLEGLKSHEGELLEAALVAHEEDMATVETLGQKREGLEASIRAIESEESSRHVQDLCVEERSLDEEIRNLEIQLAGMKTRHRRLRAEIEGLDNRVQSQLSSYRAALALAEKETREFLARPPSSSSTQTTIVSSTKIIALASASGGTAKAKAKANHQSLWDLPAGRRTLPMAQEQFRDEQRMLLHRIAEVDEERTALEEGKQVWANVVQEVTGVEQLLRDEMQRLDQSMMQPPPPRGLPPEISTPTSGIATAETRERAESSAAPLTGAGTRAAKDNDAATTSIHTILHQIDTSRAQVEQHLRTSVSHQWGLLICCVGAELEALAQGSAVLRATLGLGLGLVGDEEVGGGRGMTGRLGGGEASAGGKLGGVVDMGLELEGEGQNGHMNNLHVDVDADTDVDVNRSEHMDAGIDRPTTSFPRERENKEADLRGGVYADAEDGDEEEENEDDDDGPGADLLGF